EVALEFVCINYGRLHTALYSFLTVKGLRPSHTTPWPWQRSGVCWRVCWLEPAEPTRVLKRCAGARRGGRTACTLPTPRQTACWVRGKAPPRATAGTPRGREALPSCQRCFLAPSAPGKGVHVPGGRAAGQALSRFEGTSLLLLLLKDAVPE